MTAISQQIAIATACGWTYTKTCCNPEPTAYGRAPSGQHDTMHGKEVPWDLPLPDYLGDLSEMAQAERRLPNDGTRLRYVEELATLQTDHHPFFSTAKERAEAFLRALNLWEGSK